MTIAYKLQFEAEAPWFTMLARTGELHCVLRCLSSWWSPENSGGLNISQPADLLAQCVGLIGKDPKQC